MFSFSHDVGVVRYLSDRIAVLYLGQVMEIGPAEAVSARIIPRKHCCRQSRRSTGSRLSG